MRWLAGLVALVLGACSAPKAAVQSDQSKVEVSDEEFIQSLRDRTRPLRVVCPTEWNQFTITVDLETDDTNVSETEIIEVLDDWWGTAFIAGRTPDSKGTIFGTAEHVAPQKNCSYSYGNQVWDIEWVAADADHDTALLVTYDHQTNLPSLLDSRPYLGQKVIAVGWPVSVRDTMHGMEGTPREQVTRGTLYAQEENHSWPFVTDAFFWYGSSGGPMFDEQGRLVGLTNAGYEDNHGWPVESQNYVTPAKYFWRLYKALDE